MVERMVKKTVTKMAPPWDEGMVKKTVTKTATKMAPQMPP